jgi:hypothetical protein
MNSICIPEGSVEVEPQRDHGIVVDSAQAQMESAARASSGSSELLIRDPEVPALVDGMYQRFPDLQPFTDMPKWVCKQKPLCGKREDTCMVCVIIKD